MVGVTLTAIDTDARPLLAPNHRACPRWAAIAQRIPDANSAAHTERSGTLDIRVLGEMLEMLLASSVRCRLGPRFVRNCAVWAFGPSRNRPLDLGGRERAVTCSYRATKP